MWHWKDHIQGLYVGRFPSQKPSVAGDYRWNSAPPYMFLGTHTTQFFEPRFLKLYEKCCGTELSPRHIICLKFSYSISISRAWKYKSIGYYFTLDLSLTSLVSLKWNNDKAMSTENEHFKQLTLRRESS